MNEQNKKQVIMLGVLGIALVGVFVYQFGLLGGGDTPTATRTATQQTAQTATPILRVVDVDPMEMMNIVTYTPPKYTRARNPLEPAMPTVIEGMEGQVTVGTEEIRGMIQKVREKNVSAIVYDNVSPMAVVDNEVVGLGYVYPEGLVRIHAIEPDKVIFEVEQMLVPVDIKEL